MTAPERLRIFLDQFLRTPLPRSTPPFLDANLPETESPDGLARTIPWTTAARPDDVCAHCWEGVFAEGFGLRSVPLVLHEGAWYGGYEWSVSHDELMTCKALNCMWYRCLEPDVFGAMLTRFEGAANDARMDLAVGNFLQWIGVPEGEVLMVVIERRELFKISIGADNPTAAWIKEWAGTLGVGTPDVLAYAKTCIDECLREHTSCRDFFDWAKPEASLPMRLIDCSDPRRPRLILTKDWNPYDVQYIALSYAWGGEQPNCTTKKNISSYLKAIRVSRLPKTIVDAIQVVHALGIQYLWVDSLCIIQDSHEDWDRELMKMRNVYRQAFLVIDAASAANASQGFLHDSDRIQMDASFWLPFDWSQHHKGNPRRFTELLHIETKVDLTGRNPGVQLRDLVKQTRGHTGERAWCLQETLMSGRRLCFAETLHFRCRQSLQCRAVGGDFIRKFYGDITTHDIIFRPATTLLPYSADWFTIHAAWSEVVEDYTVRTLSRPEDTLRACAGVAEAFGQALGPQSEYLAGLWRDSIIFDLLWAVTTPFRGIRDCRDTLAPSWSWAATCHPVGFMPWLLYRNNPATPFELLGEVVECAVTLENRALLFGRVTEGHLILRVPLLGPYKAEVLQSQLHDYLLLDEGYEPNDPKCTQRSLWLAPLLCGNLGHKKWVVHCLVLQQLDVQPVAASSPSEGQCLEGTYQRVGGCMFGHRESEGRDSLGQLQVISLRSRVDGHWTFPRPRKDIKLV